MINIKSSAVAVMAATALVASPVVAASEGQIEGGNIYRIKNITQNVDFTDPANAKSCDVLQYKVRIHNPGPGELSNVNVKANVPAGSATSNTSTITVSSQNADPSSTSDTATVNFASAQSISYVAGSTQLLDANGNVIKTLPDGITEGGVNIGNVGVSLDNKRFVQFQEKVNCAVGGKVTPSAEQPAALPETGAGALAGLAGSGALGYAVVQYRNSRKALAESLRK